MPRPPKPSSRPSPAPNPPNLADLTLDFTHGSALEGRWTCIAGINGAGKSAILQALALALLGEDFAADVGSELLQRLRRREGERAHDTEIEITLRRGDKPITIALFLGDKGLDRDRIKAHSSYPEMRAFWDARAQHHVVVGYGAGRNLSERLAAERRARAGKEPGSKDKG